MTRSRHILGLVFLLLVLASCKPTSKSSRNTISTVAPPTSATGTVSHIAAIGGAPFTHTQHVGTTKSDVFFVYTNPSASTLGIPIMGSQANAGAPLPLVAQSKMLPPGQLTAFARDNGIGLRGTPEISEFNTHPPAFTSGTNTSAKQLIQPHFAVVGATNSFFGLSSTEIIPSTLRTVLTDGTITVNLWVANDSWGTCIKAHCLTQAMVDAFGAKFIATGANNDIYDWVTNLYGAPWGTTPGITNLITSTNATAINILFYDISNDNSTNGGILGFFYSKDNYLPSTSVNFSNQRLMFYMDSVLTAVPSGASWQITDLWPSEMVATLAHEFQHMIHFYQKNVLLRTPDLSSNTWIHEMMSMITEDLVADKILANGPRGVAYADGTAGAANNSLGRPAYFNAYGYISQAGWYSNQPILARYAINYSFGAWLARNYGGAKLAAQLMKTKTDDIAGLLSSLSTLGYTETYESLLRNFWSAVLMSNLTTPAAPYMLNKGGYFTSTYNSINYNLGSVNFYNYGTGPKIYSKSNMSSSLTNITPYSGVLTKVATGVTGDVITTVDMPLGMNLTVIVKP